MTNRGPYKHSFVFFPVRSLRVVAVAAIHTQDHTFMHRWAMVERGCPSHVWLSEFCCDGKAAGGPLLCLYSIQVELGCLFHSSGTHGIFMRVYVEKENGYRSKYPTARCMRVCVRVFVCVGNTSNGRLMIGLIDTQQ